MKTVESKKRMRRKGRGGEKEKSTLLLLVKENCTTEKERLGSPKGITISAATHEIPVQNVIQFEIGKQILERITHLRDDVLITFSFAIT